MLAEEQGGRDSCPEPCNFVGPAPFTGLILIKSLVTLEGIWRAINAQF